MIVDEVGFEPFTREEANQFFRLVSYRYQLGAICITSNKAVKDWPEMLAGDCLASQSSGIGMTGFVEVMIRPISPASHRGASWPRVPSLASAAAWS